MGYDMTKAAYDFNEVGQGRMSVYLPCTGKTKGLRDQLERRLGSPSVEHITDQAVEWFVDSGRVAYRTFSKWKSWQRVFRAARSA